MSNGRKPTFFWADLHIGHFNSIKLDNRPFQDLTQMHTAFIKNYNAQVPENGICYFLGDVATHGSELTKQVISQMRGTKVLILGNHDKNSNACYAMGFDVVLNNATIYIQGERVTISHCPLPGIFRENVAGMHGAVEGENFHGESRHKPFMVPNEGQFHLHGHIHSPNGGKSEKIVGRQFDVGVVNNKYRPVPISVIEAWIDKTKNEENKG
jgi:calcineurin-like phosphoesterase family protein